MSDAFQGLIFFDSPYLYLNDMLFQTPEQGRYSEKREIGRWSIAESQVYLQVMRRCEGKDAIRELRKAIPNRIESQIRAHHQKMLKKYGSIERIIEVSGRKENKKLIGLNKRLQVCLGRLKQIEAAFPLANTIKQEEG